MDAGAVVTNATCAPVRAVTMGVLRSGRDLHHGKHPPISAAAGRSERAIYMASPATVAASALTGVVSIRRILAGGMQCLTAMCGLR